jgi:hypothetical protein
VKIETWESDNNKEEVHHFVEGEQNTYLFGFNRRLLGEVLYEYVKGLVQARLQQIKAKKEKAED